MRHRDRKHRGRYPFLHLEGIHLQHNCLLHGRPSNGRSSILHLPAHRECCTLHPCNSPADSFQDLHRVFEHARILPHVRTAVSDLRRSLPVGHILRAEHDPLRRVHDTRFQDEAVAILDRTCCLYFLIVRPLKDL